MKNTLMVYHIIGMLLASTLVSTVMMLGDNSEYFDAPTVVLLGTAIALTVLPVVIVLFPSALCRVVAGKWLPYGKPILWCVWLLLISANIYNNLV